MWYSAKTTRQSMPTIGINWPSILTRYISIGGTSRVRNENQNTIAKRLQKLHKCQCIDIDPLTLRHVVTSVVYSMCRLLWGKCFSQHKKKPWIRVLGYEVWNIIVEESSELNDIAEIKQKYWCNHRWRNIYYVDFDFNGKVELSQISLVTRWFFNFSLLVPPCSQLID